MLLDLIVEWAGIIDETSASARMAELKADLSETWFAWSGPTTFESGTNITSYYRIQGPHLVIEYAPQNDEPANHVHTIYRDPTNDYGKGGEKAGTARMFPSFKAGLDPQITLTLHHE